VPEVVRGAVGEAGELERGLPNLTPEVHPRDRPAVDVKHPPRLQGSRHARDRRDATFGHVDGAPRALRFPAGKFDYRTVDVSTYARAL
jgi:hypothetical protein